MQFSYNISLNLCQCLLKNYTKLNKYSDPKDYEGKIVFISSNKPVYHSFHNKQFNLSFKAACSKQIISHCLPSYNRNIGIEYEWSSFNIFTNISYAPFDIGNFTIDTKSFSNQQLEFQTFIPSDEEIIKFEKSAAAKKYYYLKNGYFFDKSFPSTNLKHKLYDCTPNDKMIEFKIFNSDSISVLGVVEKGIIKYFNYYSIDFSGIFERKILLNELVDNFLLSKRKKAHLLFLVDIIFLTFLIVFCNRIYFSIITFALMIIFTVHIKAYCLRSFPIKFKTLFTTTIAILLPLLYLYSNKIPVLINILLLNYDAE